MGDPIDDNSLPFTHDQVLTVVHVSKPLDVIASVPYDLKPDITSNYWHKAINQSVRNMNIQWSLFNFIQDPSDEVANYTHDVEKLKPTPLYWTLLYSGNENYGTIIPDYLLLIRGTRDKNTENHVFSLNSIKAVMSHKIPEILFVTMLYEPDLIQERLELVYNLLIKQDSKNIKFLRKNIGKKYTKIDGILNGPFLEYIHEFDYSGKGGLFDGDYQKFKKRHQRHESMQLESNELQLSPATKWKCMICSYETEDEFDELPEDYECAVCGAYILEFERL